MPATPSIVTRKDDPTGDSFKTFDDLSGSKAQGVANDPDVMGRVLSWVQSGGTASNVLVCKITEGALFRAEVTTVLAPATDLWLMVFDSAAAPAAAAIPVLRAKVTGGYALIDLGAYGREMTDGIHIAISTSPATLAIPAAGEGFFQASFI